MALNNNNNDTSCKCTTPEYEIVLNEQGPQGRQGEKGEAGFTPIISVKDNTDSNYTLNILTQDGQITTPNLKANLPAGGATGQVLTKNSGEQDDCSWQNLPNATTEVEGIARLATPSDFEATEDSEVSNTSIVTPALFNTEFNKQSANFVTTNTEQIITGQKDFYEAIETSRGILLRGSIAGRDQKNGINPNVLTYQNGPGNIILGETKQYTDSSTMKNVGIEVKQNNVDNDAGLYAHKGTDVYPLLDSSNVIAGDNITIDKTATGITINSTGGGSELLPATKDSLGGIIVGDGLKVDGEGLTSLDISVQQPLSLVGDVPANPHIESGADGKGYLDQDVIAFNPANGSTPANNFNLNKSDNTLTISNRTNGNIDWKNNIVELPFKTYTESGAGYKNNQFCFSINAKPRFNESYPQYVKVGIILGKKDTSGNITPLLLVTLQNLVAGTGSYLAVNIESNLYIIKEELSNDNTNTTYSLDLVNTQELATTNWLGYTQVIRFLFGVRNNAPYFNIRGNRKLTDSDGWYYPDQDPGAGSLYMLFEDVESSVPIDTINEINYIGIVFAPYSSSTSFFYNDNYPLLAQYTGATEQSTVFDDITQHYVEASAASGKPVLSLNIDGTTITTNSEGQLQANIPSNLTTQGNTFNGASQLVQLDSTGKLPAIDGSQLTNLPTGNLKYWTGTETAYTEIATKNADTLYRTTDTNKVFLGEISLTGSGASENLQFSPLQENGYTNTENITIE